MWKIIRENREKVRELLKKRKYDDVSLTGWGRLDEIIVLMKELGILKELEKIERDMEEGYIPMWFINNSLALSKLLGEKSIRGMQEGMFRDAGVLRIIGCTAKEMREGFDSSRNKGENKPCNVDALRYSVSNTPVEEALGVWENIAKSLRKNGISKGTTYIIDATKLLVYGDYEGAGENVIIEKVITKTGKIVKRKKIEKGFKIVYIQSVYKGKLGPIESFRIIPINEHEITVADELVEEVGQRYGKERVKLLLVDRGFLDGARVKEWKKEGIDVIIPLKKNMDLLKDMNGLLKLEGAGRAARRKGLEVVGFEEMSSLESYEGRLNGLLVTTYKGKKIPEDRRWGFLTTLPLDTEKKVLAAYDAYDDRSLIENKTMRELKQGWDLPKLTEMSKESVYMNIFLEALMYDVLIAYRSKKGDHLIDRGVRRIRREEIGGRIKVIVFVDRWYGVIEFRDFLALLERSPTGELDNVRFDIR